MSREHRAQAHRAVADDHDGATRADACGERGVVAGAHHVGEREQAGEQRIVRCRRCGHERAVGQRDPDTLTLAGVDLQPEAVGVTPPETVLARRVHAVAAVHAGVVAHGEGRDDEVADAQRRDLGTDVVDDADELVTDAAGLRRRGDPAVGPEVGPADAGGNDAHDRVTGPVHGGFWHVLDADVPGGMDESGAQAVLLDG